MRYLVTLGQASKSLGLSDFITCGKRQKKVNRSGETTKAGAPRKNRSELTRMVTSSSWMKSLMTKTTLRSMGRKQLKRNVDSSANSAVHTTLGNGVVRQPRLLGRSCPRIPPPKIAKTRVVGLLLHCAAGAHTFGGNTRYNMRTSKRCPRRLQPQAAVQLSGELTKSCCVSSSKRIKCQETPYLHVQLMRSTRLV